MPVDYEVVESLLNALWCETLRLPHAAAQDNFIDLGGNSLADSVHLLINEGLFEM